ncbi:MAG: hypothetical protein ABIF71_03730 [Planctomycetota bacterium]
MYEVYKGTGWSRGAGIWAQSQAIMNLMDLGERTGNWKFRNAALGGIRYLESLQCLDFRYPEVQGAFWEHIPNDTISLVRDAATGCFAFNYLYAHTGKAEYLERARMFCDWYMKYGCKKENCWPWMYFDFVKRHGYNDEAADDPGIEKKDVKKSVDGDWQAGGGLALLYTGLQSGDAKYIEEGFKPMMDKVYRLYQQYGDDPAQAGWHGETPITYGNDDFVFIAMAGALRHCKDERFLDILKKRVKIYLGWMADDGSYPNFGATFVCSIELLEYLRLAEEYGFSDNVKEVREAVALSAEFGMTLQERTLNDRFFYGGLYGQTSFGVERDRIHQRCTGYSMNFYLKLEGGYWPRTFSSYGWGIEGKAGAGKRKARR